MKVIYHHSVGPWMERRLPGLGDSDDLEVEVVAPNDKELSDEMLSTVEVVWHVLEPFTADHISAAPRLRLIQKIGVGVNTIDVEAESARVGELVEEGPPQGSSLRWSGSRASKPQGGLLDLRIS